MNTKHTTTKLLPSIVYPLATLIGSILVFIALGKTAPSERPEASNSLAARMQRLPPAGVVPVQSLSLIDNTIDIQVDGEVVPYREIRLATEVEGQIVFKSPRCEAGNYVEKGEILFRIDPTNYKLELDRLEKQQQQEYGSLREIDQELVNISKMIELSKTDEELREKEIARFEKLPTGFASETEIDNAKKSRLQALNTRVGYENQLELAKKRRNRQQAQEQLVETQLELARKNLERTEIKAPVSGVVFREDAEVNSFVQRGTVIVTLEDTDKAEVIANLRMDQLYWVLDQAIDQETADLDRRSYHLPRTRATVEYRLNGRNSVHRWEGWLERYDGIGVDSMSRMVPVRVMVDAPGETLQMHSLNDSPDTKINHVKGPKALVRGMFVQVIFHVRPQTQLALVPNLALQPGNRLWKFDTDASVLDVIEVEEDSNDEESQPAKTVAPDSIGETVSEDLFDASLWMAGRLEILRDVNSIAAVEIPIGDSIEKYWICEAKQGELKPGDYVVVTPLGSVVGDGSDYIRAKVREQTAEAASGSVASASENSVKQ